MSCVGSIALILIKIKFQSRLGKHGGSTDIPFQQTLVRNSARILVVTSRKSSLHGRGGRGRLLGQALLTTVPLAVARDRSANFSRSSTQMHFDSYWIQFLFLSVNSEESLFRCEGQLEEPPLARAVVMSHFFSPWPCATSKAVSPMLTQRERTCCCLKNGVLNCPDLVETSAEECSQTKTNDECLYGCIAK